MLLVLLIAQKIFQKNQASLKLSPKLTRHINQEIHGKKLLCITPAGTISFISKSYGGTASNRFITETCGIVEKLQFGDNLMADKGFSISDLLVSKGSRLVIPPFLRDKNRVSKKNCTTTSNVAKARIHVERAIARIKDFRIFNGAFPITLKDQLDDIFTICCALTNLGPALVPLQTYSLHFFFFEGQKDLGRMYLNFSEECIYGRMYLSFSLHSFAWYKLLPMQ